MSPSSSSDSTGRLAVIIPMFNEQGHAERCVRAVCAVLRDKLPGGRLFVVNDGSRDETPAILRRLSEENLPLTFVDQAQNGGYGAALLAGARRAYQDGFEFGLFMDSDLTNDPALIPRFAELLAGDQYDLVKASRYVPGGGMRGVPWQRQAVTIVGNKIASRLFGLGLRDCTNGFRAVRLSMIVDAQFHERGFPQIVEELLYLKQKGARVAELPYILSARQAGEGESKFNYRPQMFAAYLKYAVRAALHDRGLHIS